MGTQRGASPRRSLAVLASITLTAATGLTLAAGAVAAPSDNGRIKPGTALSWSLTPTGSEARLRGLSPVSRSVAWVSGSLGTVLRTTDGGRTWQDVSPRGLGTEALQFRDIEATDARTAVILSIGEGGDSRILRTSDGGATWSETFRNSEPAAFYDCLAFTNRHTGIAMSDPVDGKVRLQRTTDGGRTWTQVDPAGIPAARDGEFGFAASGTCAAAGVGQRLYIGLGGVDPARLMSSTDGGRTWTVQDTPVRGSAAGGIFSVAFANARAGVLVGGDYLDPTGATGNAAWTADGGRTWHKPTTNPAGYRSGAAWTTRGNSTVLAVGPTGSDVSFDAGRSWRPFDSGSFDAVQCTNDGACWASGEQGRVAVLRR